MTYEFELPWPPSVNGYWRTYQSRQILSKRGRAYPKLVSSAIPQLVNERLKERLSVSLTLNPPTLAKYDIDNFTKGVFDALTKVEFWIDDEQVDQLRIAKGEKIKGGNVIVKIEILEK